MSKVTAIPFKTQLEDIRKQLEKCKIEREIRHSEFTKRFDAIVARHDRLTSDRVRRLSLEGIILDIDTIRGHKRCQSFSRHGERSSCKSPNLRRAKTDLHSYLHPNQYVNTLKNETINDSRSVYKVGYCPGAWNVEEHLTHKQLRLELSFDSKHPGISYLAKPSRLRYSKDWRHQRNQSFINSSSNQKSLRRNKFQQAFAKVLDVQRFTARRRHTILSMAPIDIGEKSKLPATLTYDKNDGQGHASNNPHQRNASHRCVTFSQPLREETGSSSGKQKFKRAIKKLESARKFADLYKSVRKDSV